MLRNYECGARVICTGITISHGFFDNPCFKKDMRILTESEGFHIGENVSEKYIYQKKTTRKNTLANCNFFGIC